MYFLKLYKSEAANASKTLSQNILISDILSKPLSAGLSRQFVDLQSPSVNFWDFGKRAATHIAKDDFVLIVCKSTAYFTEIIEKIEDDNGELSTLLDWDPIFGKPWKNPYVLRVRTACPLSAQIQKIIDCAGEPLAKNFYSLSASAVGDIFVN